MSVEVNTPSGPIKYTLVVDNGPGMWWELDLPEKGLVGKGQNTRILTESIISWRKKQGIPIGLNFAQEIEQALCEKYRESCPKCCKTEDLRDELQYPHRINYGDVVVGTRVMVNFEKSGRRLVSREEAERRAAICSGCRYNMQFSKPCGGICGALKGIIEAIVDPQGTKYDEGLHSCYICRCYLSVAIWVPLEVQWPPLSDYQKGQFSTLSHCWKQAKYLTAS